MSPTIRFDPLADTLSSTPFDAIQVDLQEENKAFLLGFCLNENSGSANDSGAEYKFDIVPCESTRGSQMKHPLAAIWYWNSMVPYLITSLLLWL